MVKINENEVLISRHELFVLIGAAGAHEIRESQLEKCDYAFTNFASHIYSHIARHIWEDKKLPEKSTNFLFSLITPAQAGKRKAGYEICEDKQSICTLLLAALQKTRALHELTDLEYSPSEVTAKFASGNKHLVNVECDSGIAMIRDIVMHL